MADPSGQPVVHGLKPMDFEDDLIVLRTHVCITPSFCKRKGGQPVQCMFTLLVLSLRRSTAFLTQKLSMVPNNTSNLDDSLVV